MIISNDLRLAIKSAYNTQRHNHTPGDWERRKAAALAHAESPKIKPLVAKAKKLQARAAKLSTEATSLMRSVGLDSDADSITDDALFAKAGGKVPAAQPKPWSFDNVMAEIAAASPKLRKALLKKYGINWS